MWVPGLEGEDADWGVLGGDLREDGGADDSGGGRETHIGVCKLGVLGGMR